MAVREIEQPRQRERSVRRATEPIVLFEAKPSGNRRGRESRQKVLTALYDFQKKNPDKLVVMKDIAEDLGISISGANMIYNDLARMGFLLPDRKRGRVSLAKDLKVKELWERGLTRKEVAERRGLSEEKVERIRTRLKKAGIRVNPHAKLDSLIIDLRDKGLGNLGIAERVGSSERLVTRRLVVLIAENKAKRLRAKRRTKEELERFDEEVKKLRGKKYEVKKVAELLGVSDFLVTASIARQKKVTTS